MSTSDPAVGATGPAVVTLTRIFWRRRRWIISTTVLATVAAVIIALVMTPIYRATAVIISASAERNSMSNVSAALGQLGGLASLAGLSIGSGGKDSETSEALAVLQSREFTQAFLRERNLLPELYAKKWDTSGQKWRVPVSEQPTLAQAYKYFDESIRTVAPNRNTGLILLQTEWRDRNKAAEWSNEQVVRLNAEMRRRAIAKADAAIGYLQRELKNAADIGTRDAMNRLIEAQIKQRMIATVTNEFAFRVVDHAMPPDAKDKVRPARVLIVLMGVVLGGLAGCMLALIVDSAS